MTVLLNFSESESSISLPNFDHSKKVLINNYNEFSVDKNTITLKPYQAVVLKF